MGSERVAIGAAPHRFAACKAGRSVTAPDNCSVKILPHPASASVEGERVNRVEADPISGRADFHDTPGGLLLNAENGLFRYDGKRVIRVEGDPIGEVTEFPGLVPAARARAARMRSRSCHLLFRRRGRDLVRSRELLRRICEGFHRAHYARRSVSLIDRSRRSPCPMCVADNFP
jgi:hypothetical protein